MRFLIAVAAIFSLGAIIDRIAIVVGKYPILDSTIEREIRVTSFLNSESPDFSLPSKKQGASRLIDQEIIREQIRNGDYPIAPQSEADRLIEELKKERFTGDAQYRRALAQARITEEELKDRL